MKRKACFSHKAPNGMAMMDNHRCKANKATKEAYHYPECKPCFFIIA
jgi:hypothetical protein